MYVRFCTQNVGLGRPAGVGKQPLFNVTATLTTASGGSSTGVSTSRRIGFRSVALVTGNDTDAAFRQQAAMQQGTMLHGMVFRVNGAVLFTRGANMVPMEELEGWYSAAAHRELVKSSADSNINMLRVWGGGIYLPQVWYDACDELGILVFHDMMYAQQGHAPKASPTQEAELRHNIRRLSAHPSIILYDGCNECTVVTSNTSSQTAIYATFVMSTVAQEDMSRVVWPSW